MKLTTTKIVGDNKFKAILATEANDLELGKIEKFGEPSINIGGSFTGPPAFVEPNQMKLLITASPFVFIKDKDGDVEAEAKVDVWAAEVRTRIIDAKTTLVGLVDSFTDETTETI
jgi:hypothetical protein